MRPTRIAVAAVCAVAMTLLSACASGDGAAPAATGASVPELAGTSWNLASYAGADGTQTPAVTEPSVGTLTFLAGGGLAGSTGCNRFTGTYEQSGAELAITTGAMTEMACPGPVGEQETAVIAALAKVATAAVASDNLVLKDAQGAQLLTYAPGLAGLEGTSWTATGINNGKQAVVSDATTSAITARFGTDNVLSGFGGCNSYTATWTTTPPDGLTIGELGQTLMACEGDVQDTENQYTSALAKVTTYQLEGNQLTLRDADGATQVTYTQATD
jgi:heat shock protein HslJ